MTGEQGMDNLLRAIGNPVSFRDMSKQDLRVAAYSTSRGPLLWASVPALISQRSTKTSVL
jgi:hypothetical protein